MIYRRFYGFPTLRSRNPFAELDRMRRQLDQWFGDEETPYRHVHAGVFPLINLTEDKDNYYVRAELPGVKADELDIQATASNLSISGERKIELENEGAKYHRREREAGKFSRLVELPDEIDPDKVTAKLDNGILSVIVAKAEIAKPKQISISS